MDDLIAPSSAFPSPISISRHISCLPFFPCQCPWLHEGKSSCRPCYVTGSPSPITLHHVLPPPFSPFSCLSLTATSRRGLSPLSRPSQRTSRHTITHTQHSCTSKVHPAWASAVSVGPVIGCGILTLRLSRLPWPSNASRIHHPRHCRLPADPAASNPPGCHSNTATRDVDLQIGVHLLFPIGGGVVVLPGWRLACRAPRTRSRGPFRSARYLDPLGAYPPFQ